MRNILVCTRLMLICIVGVVFAGEVDLRIPEKLSYMCEDIPPSNYLDNGVLKGISIEMLHAVWRKMGVAPQPIKVVPWARGYHNELTDSGQVLFSMSRTPEREKLFKWVGPIFTVKNVFMGVAEKRLVVRSLDEAKAYRIGVIKDDVVEEFLLDHGFDRQKLDGVSSLAQNFEKLRAGRIDLIAHTENTLYAYVKENGMDREAFSTRFVVSESPNYYAFSRDVPDQVVARFQKAFDGERASHATLLDKYGLSK